MVDIVEEIKKSCFNQDIQSRKNLHALLIDNLISLFRRNNYRVEIESSILRNHLRLRNGVVQGGKGYVDLLAIGQNQKIAIEFDSGATLRYNSIEKLLQSDADILIGIVRGYSYPQWELLDDNRMKIHKVMKYSGIYDRKLLLIIISEKTSEEISWQGMFL